MLRLSEIIARRLESINTSRLSWLAQLALVVELGKSSGVL